MIGISPKAEKLLDDLRIIAREVPGLDRERLALEKIQEYIEEAYNEVWILRGRLRKVIERARDKKQEVNVKDGVITDLHTQLTELGPIVRML